MSPSGSVAATVPTTVLAALFSATLSVVGAVAGKAGGLLAVLTVADRPEKPLASLPALSRSGLDDGLT